MLHMSCSKTIGGFDVFGVMEGDVCGETVFGDSGKED